MAVKICTEGSNVNYHSCDSNRVEFVGAVLATFEKNGYDDSDFVAVVWDGEKVTTTCYASTASWTYHNSARVDATDEVRALALDWYRDKWITAELVRRERNASMPYKGRTVRSLTTRGKNVGIVGEVRWYGEDEYRSNRYVTEYRVGVKVEGEEKLRYLAADRVEVVNPTPVTRDDVARDAATMDAPTWSYALQGLASLAVGV